MKDWSWRDWKDSLWAVLFVPTVIVTPLAFIGMEPGFGPTWKWLGDQSSNIASWVQAVGSIAAIALGVWAVQFQVKKQRLEADRRETESDRRRTLAALHRADGLLAVADACFRQLKSDVEAGDGVGWTYFRAVSSNSISQCDAVLAREGLPPALLHRISTVQLAMIDLQSRCAYQVDQGNEGLPPLLMDEFRQHTVNWAGLTARSRVWVTVMIRAMSTAAELEDADRGAEMLEVH